MEGEDPTPSAGSKGGNGNRRPQVGRGTQPTGKEKAAAARPQLCVILTAPSVQSDAPAGGSRIPAAPPESRSDTTKVAVWHDSPFRSSLWRSSRRWNPSSQAPWASSTKFKRPPTWWNGRTAHRNPSSREQGKRSAGSSAPGNPTPDSFVHWNDRTAANRTTRLGTQSSKRSSSSDTVIRWCAATLRRIPLKVPILIGL